jgi:hypothetical protein
MNKEISRRSGLFGLSYDSHCAVAAGLLLALAGCGEVQSLGENMGGAAPGSGGAGSNSQGGSSGGATSPTGGAAGSAAGSASAPGAGGKASSLAYPLAPSVPIDAACQCGDESLVCNAASQCVPRCDADGDCALWLIPREPAALWIEGSSLYVLETSTHDMLGNPLANPQRLLRADAATNTAPTPVAELPPSSNDDRSGRILGRSGGTTYVETDGIFAVTDAGTVGAVLAPEAYFDAALRGDSLFFTATDGIWFIDLQGRAPARVLPMPLVASPADPRLFAGDALWFKDGQQACKVDIRTIPATLDCDPTLPLLPFADREPSGFFTDYGGNEVFRQEPGKPPFRLFLTNQLPRVRLMHLIVSPPALHGDSIYVAVQGLEPHLVSVSAQSVNSPVDVLPLAVAKPLFSSQPSLGYADSTMLYVVNDAGLFWTQRFNTYAEQGLSRYVFHKSL